MNEFASNSELSRGEIHREIVPLLTGVIEPELLVLYEDFSGNLRELGSYGMVRLVQKAIKVAPTVDRGNPVSRFFKRTSSLGSREVKWADEADMIGKIKAHVVQGGLITQSEVDGIPMGDKFRIQRTHGNILLGIEGEHGGFKQLVNKKKEAIIKLLGADAFEIARSYDLGLVMSDLFEVLPREKAAAMLLSCTDPEVSEALYKGEGRQGLAGDTQALATSAIVLMPREIRHEIFKAMVEIDPDANGKTDMLFRNLVANYYQKGVSFGGASMILQNLTGEEGNEKVTEFADDFTELGQIVRAKH